MTDPAIPLSALREIAAAEQYVTLSRAIDRIDWAIRHGAFCDAPPLVIRPDMAAEFRALTEELERVIKSNIGADPEATCDDAPVGYRPRLTLPEPVTNPDPAPAAAPAPLPGQSAAPPPDGGAAAPAAPDGGGAEPQVDPAALLADAGDTDDLERLSTVAAHVALLRADHSFDPAADEYLVRATLDGVAPQMICDQLGVDMAELKERWAALQVPGVTVVNGKRDPDGCQMLLDMLSRWTELEAA